MSHKHGKHDTRLSTTSADFCSQGAFTLPLAIPKSDSLAIATVADPGGGRGGYGPPGPVKIGHKKDGRRRRLHRFHVSWPPLTRPLDPLLSDAR